eukprot:COSAG04_NODE_6550_length_1306_cov_1.540182_1_plen_147_part_10
MTPREESARNRQARSARLDESASESSSGGSSYYTSDEEDERGGYAHPQPAPEPSYTDTRPLTPRSVRVPVPSAPHAAACTETNHPHRQAQPASSLDAHQNQLLTLANELQDISLESLDMDARGMKIEWPQICVVGGQAEGESTLLSA